MIHTGLCQGYILLFFFSVCQVTEEEGKEFVVLPFITPPESLDGVEVRWFYYKDNERKELLFYSKNSVEHHDDYRNRTEMNENPLGSGNLSLTLKDPKDTDSGKYRCYVKKNNDIITVKTVLLKVKGQYLDTVQSRDEISLWPVAYFRCLWHLVCGTSGGCGTAARGAGAYCSLFLLPVAYFQWLWYRCNCSIGKEQFTMASASYNYTDVQARHEVNVFVGYGMGVRLIMQT
uniref:Ig-like domain-containing protein n=1 Tax=Sphaeramia orbicularis TaxID=375764 RepID=A0A673A653_9TELE